MTSKSNSLPEGYALTENERNEAVKILATNGFDVTDPAFNKKKALYWACVQEELKVICLLVEKGVDVASIPVDDQEDAALNIASSNNHCEAVILLLKLGSTISRKNKDGNTALHFAAAFNAIKAMKILVDAGSDLAWTNSSGRTAMHVAASYGREESIQTLLDMKVAIDVRDGSGRTPLHIAALSGMHKTLQFLIDKGADLNLKDDRGDYPLHFAALGRSLEAHKILVKSGVDLQARNTAGLSALILAAARGDVEVIQLLLDNGADVSISCIKGRTALHHAAAMGHEGAMELLIEKGADIEAQEDVYGLTPLTYAIREGYEDTMGVQFLADRGANVFVKTYDQWTALHLAAESDRRLVAQFLIKAWRGRSLDEQTEDGTTAIFLAADFGYKDMAILLLKAGANIEIPDDRGYTPLLQAVSSGHMNIARVLLEYGADPTTETKDGAMIVHLTQDKDDQEFLKKARQDWVSQGETNRSIMRLLVAAGQGRVDQLKELLDKGLDVNSKDENGRRALSLAALNGRKSALQYLLERGALINGKDRNGETASWWAARYGHQDSVTYLLDEGCNVDLADESNQTPLAAAAQMGHESIVEALLKRGAVVDIKTTYGFSALSFAAQEGHLGVVTRLLQHGAQVDQASEFGDSPISLAEDYGFEDVVDLLQRYKAPKVRKVEPEVTKSSDIQDSKSDIQVRTFRNALVSAAKFGKVARIKRFISLETPVDCLNRDGRSPLGLAAEYGQDSAVMELLNAGASVNFADKAGRTPLSWAAEKGLTSTITLLKEAGSKTEVKDKDGKTPLSSAAEFNKEEAVRLLLHHDARTESRDKKGRSALWLASEAGYDKVVSLLLENGANVECADKSGRTPLYAAVHSGRRTTTKLLLESGASMRPESEHNWSPLCAAAQYGFEEIIELLLRYGADIDYRSDERKTALMLAAEQGRAMVIKLLIEHGANVDARDDGKFNAMAYAKNVGQETQLQLLWQASTLRRTAKSLRTRKTIGENKLWAGEYYEYEPLPEEGTSIRLIELLPGRPQDLLSLELFTVSLNKFRRRPEYEALSYEWGEKNGSIPIQCNGSRLDVTPNLRTILEKLRLPTESRIIWADAVCINQEDIPERGKQVALMTEIYREATRVLMCIGEEKKHTQSAFNGLPKFVQVYDQIFEPHGGVDGAPDGAGTQARELLSKTVKKSELEGMADLYSRPYFTRAWIFQEILLSGPKGVVICGPHQCDWTTLRKALVAFSCSDLHGVSISSYKMLDIIQSEDSFNANGGIGLEYLSDIRKNLNATDPRDKVYATFGVLTKQDKRELTPDYSLSVQQVYINATRYLIRKMKALDYWWAVCNRGSIKTIPNLPSWVPDWTSTATVSSLNAANAEFVNEVALLGTQLLGKYIKGDPATTSTSLHINGFIMDRLVFGSSLSWGDGVYEVLFKPTAVSLAKLGGSLFEPYEPEPSKSKLEAAWDIVSKENPERSKILEFLAWKISLDEDIPELARKLPKKYEPSSGEWGQLSATQGDYDFAIYKAMDGSLRHNYDLVYTEKGRFALTNLHGTEPRLVVAILGGARDIALLRERKEPGERYFHYIDRLYMPDLDKMKKPEDIIEHDKVERLEIR